jgi:beta-lactamase class A
VTSAQALAEAAVARFCGTDPGRSAAVRSLRGETVAVEVRADLDRPAASLLKLPLVAAAHARLDLDAVVTRSQLAATRHRTILDVFDPDHRLRLRELCRLVLMTSDNPSAEYLLGLVGADAVNAACEALGLRETRLRVGFGDEELGHDGRVNTSTAAEALTLFEGLVPGRPALEEPLTSSLRNTRIPLRLPHDVRVPHKTGTLEAVVNDVGIVYGEATDLALSFLCDAQPDRAATSMAIGDCVAEVRVAVGETAEPPR